MKIQLSILAVAIILLFGCKKENSISIHHSKPAYKELSFANENEFIEAIDNIGQIHNQTMDDFYSKVVGYIGNNWLPTTRSQFDANLVPDVISFQSSQGLDFSGFTPFDYHASDPFPVEAQPYINSMNQLIDNYADESITEQQFINGCNALKSDVYDLVEDEEIMVSLGLYLSVGQHSAIYWSNQTNWEKFQELSGEEYIPPVGSTARMSENQKAVAYADAVGAFNGARTAWAGGVPGIIIGGSFGAACNSLATAIVVTKLKGQFGWLSDWI